jgi:hypothetical protein
MNRGKNIKLFFLSLRLFFFGLILLSIGPSLKTEIYYPWKNVYIGALEGSAWNGLVLAPQKDAAFAFRFGAEKEGKIVDGPDLFYMISEVGPQAPDGQYARIRFDLSLPVLPPDRKKDTPILIKPASKSDTLTLEWSRQDERTIIGKIQGPKYARIHLVSYFPWDSKGSYRLLPDGQVQGESQASKPAYSLLWTHRKGEVAAGASGAEVILAFDPREERALYFVAGVGDDPVWVGKRIYRYKNTKTIDSILAEEEDRYLKKRVKIQGLYEGIAEAITNNLFWMVLYQPGSHRLYTPAGRRWIFDREDGSPDHWQIFEWDAFFNSLELSIESSKHAADTVKAVLETQYPNGNVPNWRSRFSGTPDRSEPPVGGYVVLKLFQKFGDMDLLKSAYPILKKWHSFWKARKPNGQARRDGNGDGLLEWGSDKELLAANLPPWEEKAGGDQRAKWESGQDDLPNWDDVPFDNETGTLTVNCLDLNCLYALDAYCLSQMADILNLREDNEEFGNEYGKMKQLINTYLWNQRESFYFDRYWDGRFSTRKAASNFYPLIARIPDERRAQLMLKHLLNPKEFWGDYVIPSISRDDPAFSDPKNPSRQYWRGTIWPPTNYLVYQGLKAYGFDAVASEFAKKSVSLFMRSWESFQLCPENFHPLTGEAGGQRYQSWGPLFALIGLEEYLDFTPWEGFRFGMIDPEAKGRLYRVMIQGRHYDAEISRSKILLREEGNDILTVDGAAVIRHFLYAENEVRFEIKSIRPRKIGIRFLKKGKYQLLIDNQPKEIFRGKSVSFNVPDGDHTIEIQLLEDLG